MTKEEICKDKNCQFFKTCLIKNIDETSVAYLGGLRNDDVITEISFDGNTYSAEQFFNTDYELRDLLLKVNLTTNKITFKVSRVGGEQTIDVLFAMMMMIENVVWVIDMKGIIVVVAVVSLQIDVDIVLQFD